ncbi:unnamed protein product [Linum tenue]|uniref:Uncharacterized protein n=1 Tax=Linum tenue TaxID=586396 RepID=A0AAV0H766_9ROSI|nr:unnamed protein product [Linum tenue]
MKMMKSLGLLLTLFLLGFVALSLLKSCVAVPTTRSLMMSPGNPTSPYVLQHGFLSQGATMMKLSNTEDDEDVIEGRMVVESLDYHGTGANTHHDPKPPGSARP